MPAPLGEHMPVGDCMLPIGDCVLATGEHMLIDACLLPVVPCTPAHAQVDASKVSGITCMWLAALA